MKISNGIKNISKFFSILSFLAFFPAITFAATSCTGTGLGKLICEVQQIFNSIIPLLVSIGLVYFVWGVVKYVIADGEEAKKKGKDIMIYGIIGFAVISGLWGLVNMVVAAFGIGGGAMPTAPSVDACKIPDLGSTFQVYLAYITCIINSAVIPLIFGLATVMFVWGVVKFFFINADEEAKRAQGKQYMIWGIIAMAVMISIWGLVTVLGDTFGITPMNILPCVTPGCK